MEMLPFLRGLAFIIFCSCSFAFAPAKANLAKLLSKHPATAAFDREWQRIRIRQGQVPELAFRLRQDFRQSLTVLHAKMRASRTLYEKAVQKEMSVADGRMAKRLLAGDRQQKQAELSMLLEIFSLQQKLELELDQALARSYLSFADSHSRLKQAEAEIREIATGIGQKEHYSPVFLGDGPLDPCFGIQQILPSDFAYEILNEALWNKEFLPKQVQQILFFQKVLFCATEPFGAEIPQTELSQQMMAPIPDLTEQILAGLLNRYGSLQ